MCDPTAHVIFSRYGPAPARVNELGDIPFAVTTKGRLWSAGAEVKATRYTDGNTCIHTYVQNTHAAIQQAAICM